MLNIETTTAVDHAHTVDDGYDDYIKLVSSKFSVLTDPLFLVDTTGMFDAYLATFPEDQRQYHNCNACRRFVDTYGGLVTIDEDGRTQSAIWDDNAPPVYANGIQVLRKRTTDTNVVGVFLSSETMYGTPVTNRSHGKVTDTTWTHYAVKPHASRVYKHPLVSASQRMAAKQQDKITVVRALSEYSVPVLQQACTLLESEALYRSEKVLGAAKWLLDLATAYKGTRSAVLKSNLVWRAVATAPDGFCHPRSSMIGTLLDDLSEGVEFSIVKARFAEKMNPLQYQRPQAAPSVGNIRQAEKVVAALESAGALQRRFARLEDIRTIWVPAQPKKSEQEGVFSHLLPTNKNNTKAMHVASTPITWAKFQATVMPKAIGMEMYVPTRGNFAGMLTAENPDAPPILQWDTEADRNPVSSYVYSGGSSAHQWNLRASTYVKVTAVTRFPSQWGNLPMAHHRDGVILVLEGAWDTRNPGMCLFPEILKSEYHGIRSAIEAYSNSRHPTGAAEATACGYAIHAGSISTSTTVRVTMEHNVVAHYTIDRWD